MYALRFKVDITIYSSIPILRFSMDIAYSSHNSGGSTWA